MKCIVCGGANYLNCNWCKLINPKEMNMSYCSGHWTCSLSPEHLKLVNRIQWLYKEHDASELDLIRVTRLSQGGRLAPSGLVELDRMWQYHDSVERLIINIEAQLPDDTLNLLKSGD